jgi:hypothetical protein
MSGCILIKDIDMKIKTSELTGNALDWAVAQCKGIEYADKYGIDDMGIEFQPYNPSKNWHLAGPIIEREMITLVSDMFGHFDTSSPYVAHINTGKDVFGYGDTPLEAAMRCYVASKLGDEIDVPDELLGDSK